MYSREDVASFMKDERWIQQNDENTIYELKGTAPDFQLSWESTNGSNGGTPQFYIDTMKARIGSTLYFYEKLSNNDGNKIMIWKTQSGTELIWKNIH